MEVSEGYQEHFRRFQELLMGVPTGFVGISLGLRKLQGRFNSIIIVIWGVCGGDFKVRYNAFQRVSRGSRNVLALQRHLKLTIILMTNYSCSGF